MDSDTQDSIRQALEEQAQQRALIHEEIEKQKQELLRNDSYDEFNAAEMAEAALQVPRDGTQFDVIKDDQTHQFQQFLIIATNFASMPLARKLRVVPQLVDNLKRMFEQMIEEVQQYSDIANELRDLIYCFTNLVTETKHHVRLILPLLEAAANQLLVLEDVMGTDPKETLNETDRNDIKLALTRMSEGMGQLLELAQVSTEKSTKIDQRIQTMTDSVQGQKLLVERRVELTEFCMTYSHPAIAGGSAILAGGCTMAESFGGIGALVIGGKAFPPVGAIIGAAILGLIATNTVVTLVKKYWLNSQTKALQYLHAIFRLLIQLREANRCFTDCMANAKEKAHIVSERTKDIQLCLESARQRRIHRNICTKSAEATTDMIAALTTITEIDISNWDKGLPLMSLAIKH